MENGFGDLERNIFGQKFSFREKVIPLQFYVESQTFNTKSVISSARSMALIKVPIKGWKEGERKIDTCGWKTLDKNMALSHFLRFCRILEKKMHVDNTFQRTKQCAIEGGAMPPMLQQKYGIYGMIKSAT